MRLRINNGALESSYPRWQHCDGFTPLEKKCLRCNGKGTITSKSPVHRLTGIVDYEYYHYECDQCGGNGLALTKEGVLLMDFVLRHMRVKENPRQFIPAPKLERRGTYQENNVEISDEASICTPTHQ